MKIETELIETTYKNHTVTIWPFTAYVGKRVRTKGYGLAIDGRRMPVFCQDDESALVHARAQIDKRVSSARES